MTRQKGSSELFLTAIGFKIRLFFEPAEEVFYQEHFISEIRKVWGEAGFLERKSGKADFEIRFLSDPRKAKILERGNNQFYLTFKKDFKGKRLITYGYISILQLSIILKEVFIFLLRRKGFLLHGSSCIKDGCFYVFLARSGGGKSTIAKMLSGKAGFIQSGDDLFVVRKEGNNLRFSSPPFIEKEKLFSRQESEQAVFFFVNKAKFAGLKPIVQKNQYLNTLLGQIPLLTGSIDKSLLDNAISLLEKNNFYRLDSVLQPVKMLKVFKNTK